MGAKLLGLALLAGPTARAQTPPPTDAAALTEARRHYTLGAEAYRAGRFEEAAREFSAAYTLGPHPTVLYSLAQAYERLGRVAAAVEHYERYLAQAPPDAPHRAEVGEALPSLRSLLVEVAVESDVAAPVFVDGEAAGTAPGTLRVAVGERSIELRPEGRGPQRQAITVAHGPRRALTFHFARPEDATREGLHPAWFVTAVGLAGASAATAVTLGLLTLHAASAYEANPARTAAARDDGERLALAADLALGATLAFGVTAIVLGARTAWGSPPRLSLSVTPTGAGVAGSF